MTNQIRFRTKLKHLYFKFKRYILNLKLNVLTYYKFLKLKKDKVDDLNLNLFYSRSNIKIIEGNSKQSAEQEKYLKKINGNFKNILEVGFNAGHSSELFLETNSDSCVTSIDIGYWYYCKFGKKFLEKKYPNRLNVIFKDSIKALENFETINEDIAFDFIYIDGNHTYEYAYRDILNSKKFATPSTILAVDDVVLDDSFRTNSNSEPTKAWVDLIKLNEIEEIECAHFKDINRGIALGKFIF